MSLFKPNSLNCPLLLDITSPPSPTHPPPSPVSIKNSVPCRLQTTYWKKTKSENHFGKSVIAFGLIMSKSLPAVSILSYIIILILKKLVGNKSLGTKHCPVGLFSRIIPPVPPSLPEMFPLLMLLCLP